MSPPFDGSDRLARMAARKVKAPSADPDVRRAEWAAKVLLDTAADLTPGGSLRARALIRRVHDALVGITERDTTRREALFYLCREYGAGIRVARKQSVVPAERNPVEAIRPNLMRSLLNSYSFDVPDLALKVEKHQALVWALVCAHAKLPGARSVQDAAEALFRAMGFYVDYPSFQRIARRHRKRGHVG